MRIARVNVQRKARCTQPPAATSSPRAESFTAARAREPVQNHTTPSTYTTPSTCAHTATIARNNVTEASANASSATARNMTFSPFRTNKEHLFPNRSGSQGSNFRSFRLSLRTVNRHSAWGTRFLFDGAGLPTPGDAVQKRIKGIREGQKWMTTASGIRTRRASARYLAISGLRPCRPHIARPAQVASPKVPALFTRSRHPKTNTVGQLNLPRQLRLKA